MEASDQMGGSVGLAGTITILLRETREGELGARDRLFDAVYDDLRRLAHSQLSNLGRSGTIEGTALVHSACERLLGKGQLDAEDRKHFFFLLSRAMHDVLVEHIRAENALRRGGGHQRVPLVEFATDGQMVRLDLLAVHEAIEELRGVDAQAAQVVQLRFFAGRTLEQCEELMGVSFAMVRRHWDYAKAWLHERLSRGSPS